MNANANVTGVKVGTDTVHIGDLVGEHTSPWIKAMVIGIEEVVSPYTEQKITELTVVWLKDERHGNNIARKGRIRKYVVGQYGVSDVHKVS